MLVSEGVPLALGHPAPAAILDDDHVAIAGIPGWVGVAQIFGLSLVVGMAHQQDGPGTRALGAVDITVEQGAIPHTAGHIALHNHIAITCGWVLPRWSHMSSCVLDRPRRVSWRWS